MAINIKAELSHAVQWHRQGEVEKAAEVYRKILSICPDHAAALNLAGLAEYQKGRFESASRMISLAIQSDNKIADYYNNLGTVFRAMGKMNKAREAYLEAMTIDPDSAETAYNIGGLFLTEGDAENAIVYYEKAILKRESYFQAHTNLAAIYNRLKRYQKALAVAKKGLEYAVDDFALLTNLGNALNGLGRWKEGLSVLKRAIDLYPENFEGYLNLGNTLQNQGKLQEALVSYQKASMLKPGNAKIHNDLGTLLEAMGKAHEALRCYQHAIRLNPQDAFPYQNMGTVLQKVAERRKAIRCFKKAISISPSFVEAHISLSIALQEAGEHSEAVDSFYRAISLDSDNVKLYCHLVRSLQHECRWKELARYGSILDRYTRQALKKGQVPDELPFLNLTRHCNPLLNYKVAKARSDDLARRVAVERETIQILADSSRRRSDDKITIGYLSNNFKNHPTAHLITGLFKYHDRDRFNIYCYSYGKDDGSLYRKSIERNCDRFIDILSMDYMDAARQICNDQVDILVDLVGQMRATRMEIPALRPAPLQVRWMGMAGTSGADFYDYIITDRIVTPEVQADFYSERFAYMPHTYQINNDTQHVAGEKFQREGFGLPEEAFVYGCFCTTYKIEPFIYGAWMRILKQVPGSILWLLEPSPEARDRLRIEAKERGVDPQRIVFAEKVERSRHIARIGLADMCLDTAIVNGAATTSEILWAETPVLTLQGRHFASRMAASILSAMELPELIADTLDAYEKTAAKLAVDYDFYRTIKNKVKTKKKTSVLFDTASFVKNLENLFIQMLQCHVRGDKRKIIEV